VPPGAPPHSNKFIHSCLARAWRVFRFRIPVGGDRSARRKIPEKLRFEVGRSTQCSGLMDAP
jgi:hypothetical protein